MPNTGKWNRRRQNQRLMIRGGADVKVGTAEKVSKVREDKAR